ncbi:MAG: hypothetical protein FWF52_08020 [Candidatus Azobacteroides sp.]|nr:hypothetical protein [Candidatus Azobacteroides sp.]
MKHLFCIFPLFISFLMINAQPYQRCLDEGMTRWSFLDYHVTDVGWVSTEIVAYGDTLLNNHVYKKMYQTGELEYSNVLEDNENWKNSHPDLSNWENVSTYIRESEDASKLYLYNSFLDTEYLISDLDLQEGDTLAGYPIDPPNEVCDYVVNSVYFQNGLKHIHLIAPIYLPIDYYPIFPDDYYSITLIEGVGPDAWYRYPIAWSFGSKGILNCFQNQTVFYKNEKTGCPCGYWSSPNGIKELAVNNFTIAVKQEQIEILFFENESVRVELYDLFGRLWHSRKLSTKQYTIETASFPKGVHLLKIFDLDKNQIKVSKIVLY